MKFEEFKKIPRLSREMVITEKIDGTNGQILIVHKMDLAGGMQGEFAGSTDLKAAENDNHIMFAGSRTRWLTEKEDNHSFFKWVKENAECLFKLGEGRHYGEWWGQGIQRNYGLKEKRFSLFNVKRWVYKNNPLDGTPQELGEKQEYCPDCCYIVPVLYEGLFNTEVANKYLESLIDTGSRAAPGFMNPEGVIIYHKAANTMFKKTIEKDQTGKGE